MTAQRHQAQQPRLLFDVGDHEPDLVHVRGQHQRLRGLALARRLLRNHVPQAVHADLVGHRPQLPLHDLPQAPFSPGNPGALAKLLQQLHILGHSRNSSGSMSNPHARSARGTKAGLTPAPLLAPFPARPGAGGGETAP